MAKARAATVDWVRSSNMLSVSNIFALMTYSGGDSGSGGFGGEKVSSYMV